MPGPSAPRARPARSGGRIAREGGGRPLPQAGIRRPAVARRAGAGHAGSPEETAESRERLAQLRTEVGRLLGRLDATLSQVEGRLRPVLAENLLALRRLLGASQDIVYRDVVVAPLGVRAAVVYVDGLVESALLAHCVLRPLVGRGLPAASRRLLARAWAESEGRDRSGSLLRALADVLPVHTAVRAVFTLQDVAHAVTAGEAVLLLDGVEGALAIPARGYEERGVEEPDTEAVIRGPRDGFTETLATNIALIRRKLRDTALRVEVTRAGRRSRTDLAVLYIADVANPHLVREVRARLERLQTDGVLESGNVEQFIEDHAFSPFPQVQSTERPDRVVANLLEGRVAILVDGTPFGLIVPSVFSQFYQAPEDYYERFLISTLVRGIRVGALFFSLTFTSLYVALISFHPEMLPTRFAIAVAGGRATVPFPSVVEAIIMEISMEFLREASVRLPRAIGPTVSIVGALIIGEAAVRAGIVSPLMVVIVAMTTIASFAIPSYSAAIALRILKFPIILAAGVLGLYGVMIAIILVVVHLASLKSFGVPYLAPLAPTKVPDLKDTLVRLMHWTMARRPVLTRSPDPTRMPAGAPHTLSRPGARHGSAP